MADRPNQAPQVTDAAYQCASERYRLGKWPTKSHRNMVIKDLIRELLACDPDKTTREIVSHVRELLGSVGNEAVTYALTDLVETSKEVTVRIAAHRAFVYRLVETVTMNS